MSALFRAIFENEFHRPLKRPPMLLVGGLAAWGVLSSAHERKPSEWEEAHTLSDADLEEQATPKQTTLDLSLTQTTLNVLDQEERLAVIRKKRKITQLLGTSIPPYTLGPAIQDRPSMERK
jgi:hypothetical protein